MRAALVAVVLAWVAAAVAVQCWLPALHSHAAHPSHPLVTSLGGEFAINLDHAHLTDKSKLPCPKQFATAVLPRSATPSFAAAAVVAVAAIAGMLADLVVGAGRGPPAAPVFVRAGQDLLTRFCLARR
jgi:hypothetical protein